MCAINGSTTSDEARVVQMNERTKHRGPDGSSVYSDGKVTLGHNRLAIIDTSSASAQPMRSTDGRYVIVFNGEIYNFRELRAELESQYIFTSHGDTEVLLAAYATWGEEMFSKLRGIFAFAIWDTYTETLILARDHMGVKPLYYTIENGILSFSSEIPALLVGVTHSILDRERLGFFLAMEYVPGPRTLVEHIQKLQPGYLLTFKDGVSTVRSYVLNNPLPVKHVSNERIYETLDTAVSRQLVSDRPIGAYLSGGFDSSIVVHHMAKHSAQVRTYSVDFETVQGEESEGPKFNADALLAAKTADFYGTQHKKLTISIHDVRDTIEKAIASSDEPIANATAITQYLLSDFVRKDGVIVVLGGDGGDELFGGYTRHRLMMGAYLFQKLPQSIQKLSAIVHPRLGKLATPFFTPLHMALMVKDEKKLNPLLNSPLAINQSIQAYFDALYAAVPQKSGRHPLDVFMDVDRQTWLADECFIRSDFASMAHGIELRVPFVDLDVVQCANEISIWEKTLPHQGKRIIRKVYKKYLPPHLYSEPKRGWLSPAAKWFRDPVIHAFAKEVFSSGYYSGLDSVFNWEEVQKMLNAHVEKRGYYLYPLWNILVLQIWAREHKLTIFD
jgi:asparagine synthase (glutamine-hydrolysing)